VKLVYGIYQEDISPFNDVFNLQNKCLLLCCVSIVTEVLLSETNSGCELSKDARVVSFRVSYQFMNSFYCKWIMFLSETLDW
jgi:hypothetical protein